MKIFPNMTSRSRISPDGKVCVRLQETSGAPHVSMTPDPRVDMREADYCTVSGLALRAAMHLQKGICKEDTVFDTLFELAREIGFRGDIVVLMPAATRPTGEPNV